MKTHQTHIRVRYQETDNMGVVYYANYLVWFEIARSEYFRSLGISYKALENRGFFMMVSHASCVYKSPVRYDDIVKVQSSVAELRNSSMKFSYKVYVGQRLAATGESGHVFTDRSYKPVRMPQEIRNAHLKDQGR